jgi:hypothetical protein
MGNHRESQKMPRAAVAHQSGAPPQLYFSLRMSGCPESKPFNAKAFRQLSYGLLECAASFLWQESNKDSIRKRKGTQTSIAARLLPGPL